MASSLFIPTSKVLDMLLVIEILYLSALFSLQMLVEICDFDFFFPTDKQSCQEGWVQEKVVKSWPFVEGAQSFQG